ncbi:proton-coupled amino acid transporter-like protein CG1139 [Helicoverpa zea]|uniref:proton-coupled amino acid transporter-like protein CG1139 n=1 Tax=Helicoverpa zea TaxID=7113 RepID=UPI001F59AB3D|nr:proton-coupled amino acid transporter-like protein CG1139 [Helicoverpa zea]
MRKSSLAQDTSSRRLPGQEARRLSGQEARRLSGQEARRLSGQEARRLSGQESRRLSGDEPLSTIDFRRTRLPSMRPDIDDYDPRDHRKPVHKIKVWMAYSNLFRATTGVGMLAMPFIISTTGILLGPILCLLTGILMIHAHSLLLDTLYEVARQLKMPYISYRYAFRLALLHGPPIFHGIANYGPIIIATCLFVSQLGICSVIVIFTTDCLRDLMDWQASQTALISLIFPYFVMEFFMRNFTIVSYVAVIGTILNLLGIALVFEHLIEEAQGETIRFSAMLNYVLFSFGVMQFNLCAIGVVMAVDKHLENPRVMRARFGVINVGIMIPTIITLIFGTVGYWGFGTMEENILRCLPFQERTSLATVCIYMLAMILTYPLQSAPAIHAILEVVKYYEKPGWPQPSEDTLFAIENISKPIFVVLSFLICYIVPFQAPFLAFVGNLCASMLALVFPAVMDLCLRYPHYYGKHNLHLFKDMAMIFVGIASILFGCIFTTELINIRLKTKYSPNSYGFF